jgi:hypothetical protein
VDVDGQFQGGTRVSVVYSMGIVLKFGWLEAGLGSFLRFPSSVSSCVGVDLVTHG